MLGKSMNKHGFTLIEIIVVIVILAVLMAVAVPSVMSYINEGNKTKYEAIARTALINTQIAVAKDIADDGKADDYGHVVYWVDGFNNNDEGKKAILVYGSKRSYGDNARVYVTNIVLSGTMASGNNELVSAEYAITLDRRNYREVDVSVNGKMIVGDNTFQRVQPKNGNRYTFTGK